MSPVVASELFLSLPPAPTLPSGQIPLGFVLSNWYQTDLGSDPKLIICSLCDLGKVTCSL